MSSNGLCNDSSAVTMPVANNNSVNIVIIWRQMTAHASDRPFPVRTCLSKDLLHTDTHVTAVCGNCPS